MPGGEWDSLETATQTQVMLGIFVLLFLKQLRSKTDSKASPVSTWTPQDERDAQNGMGRAEKNECSGSDLSLSPGES